MLPPEDGFPRAKAAAARALELDPGLAEAHTSLGLGLLFWDHDWPAAERAFSAAVRLNPQLATPHALYAIYLSTVGRTDEAIEESRLAQKIDPLSLLINMSVCWSLHFAGRHEEAIHETRRTQELSPGFHAAGVLLVNSYEDLGQFEEAARLMGSQPCFGMQADPTALVDAYRSGGPQAYWRKRLELLDCAPPELARMVHYAYAVVYTHLGEHELALERLQRLVDERSGGCVFMAVDPCLRRLRPHPRFQELVRQVGVPMASTPHTVSS